MTLSLNWLFVNIMEERIFLSKVIRAVCEGTYGEAIPATTWARWRSWSSQLNVVTTINKRAKYLDYSQSLFLRAIAHLRAEENKHGRPARVGELKGADIRNLMNDSDFQRRFQEALAECDRQGYVSGKEALVRLQVSRRKLERKLPNFSTLELYSMEYLESVLTY